MMRMMAQATGNRTMRAAIALVLGLTCASTAAARPADDTADRLEQMQREIERLREDNRAMRTEIGDLRVQTGDNWLTEKRSQEIRAIVHDVLADADTRTSLLGDGLMAGWSDGFFLADARGRFRLELQGQLQFRWVFNYHGRHTPQPGLASFYPADTERYRHGFENSRTRLTFRGHVFGPDITYLVRGDFQRAHTLPPGPELAPDRYGGFFNLLDAWMRFHLSDEWSLRVGQFKLPFTREQLVSSAHQLAVERSVVDSRLNIGRGQGIDLTFVSGPHRASLVISDGGTTTIGGSNALVGSGDSNAMSTGAVNSGIDYAATARYEHLLSGEWRQFEDFTSRPGDEVGVLLGAAVHYQRAKAVPGVAIAHRWWAATIDASLEWGGSNAFASITYHRFDERFLGSKHHTWGAVLHGGFYVLPKWEIFGRYEYGDWRIRQTVPALGTFTDHLEEAMHLFTTGVNYYIDGHDVKWTSDLGVGFTRISHAWGWNPTGVTGWRAASGGNPLQIVFRTQLQLLF